MGFLGIDIGGTSIKAGIVSREGRVLAKSQIPTAKEAGVAGVLDRVTKLVDALRSQAGPDGLPLAAAGVGVPGSVEVDRGLVRLAPNLGWRDVPLREKLQDLLKVPVIVDNDAHMAALGEMWQGAGRGYRDILMITLGTGIGSALILNGAVHRGVFGYGAEMGHVKVLKDGPLCRCGGRGCLETLASATAMVSLAGCELERGYPSLLSGRTRLEAREIVEGAAKGDVLSREVLNAAAHYLGTALANAALLVGPAVIIIGGGVAQAGDVVLTPIREAFAEALGAWQVNPVPILAAQLGNDAGFIGAAYSALHPPGA
ncbi:ROK family protein [Thermanaeromonas sp. C210]|uniref:ROK family protein n=1 Tax=Thermanaeromonas sp. C210 TaxID=2731925 RepID=UPI00155C588D|nr:ROK family protein [Thermanaeromonas sp. C210]GFN24087.1 glucokinase [Thermanaeromonas sp. C210]